jgi:Cu-Zn family superoxide dismutase
MRFRLLLAALCTAVALAGLSTIVFAQRAEPRSVRVTLKNVNGDTIGKATLRAASARAPVDVRVSVSRLQPGFHGFHIHAVGTCTPPDFTSAGGHLKAADQVHSSHSGDMSSLLVKGNGTATLRLTTDRFRLGDLRDADGSAVMVHAEPDNFANIPPRYAPEGPDQATLDTGDSGARVACGEIAAAAR